MKVRILSGNDAGAVREMEQVEAEQAINTGFGESAEVVEEAKPAAKEKAPAKKTSGKAAKKTSTVAKKKGRK